MVTILDDAHDEDEETFRLRLSAPSGAVLGDAEAVGRIANSDSLPQAWLARFGRAAASQAVDAVAERLARSAGAPSHLTLGGHRLNLTGGDGDADLFAADRSDADLFAAGGPFAAGGRSGAERSWNSTGREFLLGSSFHLASEDAAGGRWAAWGGQAAAQRFEGENDGLSLDGEVATGVFGADWARDGLVAGLAVTHSRGEGEGKSTDMDLAYDFDSTMTAVNPYVRLALSERVSAWAMAGWGRGDLGLTKRRKAAGEARSENWKTDLEMTLGAVGARGELLTPAESGGFGLALKGDALWVRTESDAVEASPDAGRLAAAQGDASRLRLSLEGSRPFALAGGGLLTPILELGLRHDGGDAETGAGLDLGGGLSWSAPSSRRVPTDGVCRSRCRRPGARIRAGRTACGPWAAFRRWSRGALSGRGALWGRGAFWRRGAKAPWGASMRSWAMVSTRRGEALERRRPI